MDYTKKIKTIRGTLGLSQEALGKRIGLTNAHISRLESGKSPITEAILEKYIEVFGVDPEWLNSENEDEIRFTVIQTDGLKSIGDRIRETRLEMGLSQKKFAEFAGIHPSDINKLESGKASLGPKTIGKIAEALHVGIDWLQYGDENRKEYPVDQKMIDWLWDNPEMRKQITEEMKWVEDTEWSGE